MPLQRKISAVDDTMHEQLTRVLYAFHAELEAAEIAARDAARLTAGKGSTNQVC